MNFLETLVAEWYEYTGYFVRTNTRVNTLKHKPSAGGWDMELDVLAYSRGDERLIHLETSSDANSWPERKRRFLEKKFILSQQEYETLIGFKVKKVERIAIVGWSKTTKADLIWRDDISVRLIPDLIAEITAKLRKTDPQRQAVPEGFPLVRAMQMAIRFQNRAENRGQHGRQ